MYNCIRAVLAPVIGRDFVRENLVLKKDVEIYLKSDSYKKLKKPVKEEVSRFLLELESSKEIIQELCRIVPISDQSCLRVSTFSTFEKEEEYNQEKFDTGRDIEPYDEYRFGVPVLNWGTYDITPTLESEDRRLGRSSAENDIVPCEDVVEPTNSLLTREMLWHFYRREETEAESTHNTGTEVNPDFDRYSYNIITPEYEPAVYKRTVEGRTVWVNNIRILGTPAGPLCVHTNIKDCFKSFKKLKGTKKKAFYKSISDRGFCKMFPKPWKPEIEYGEFDAPVKEIDRNVPIHETVIDYYEPSLGSRPFVAKYKPHKVPIGLYQRVTYPEKDVTRYENGNLVTELKKVKYVKSGGIPFNKSVQLSPEKNCGYSSDPRFSLCGIEYKVLRLAFEKKLFFGDVSVITAVEHRTIGGQTRRVTKKQAYSIMKFGKSKVVVFCDLRQPRQN
jgi:hypothetical protein